MIADQNDLCSPWEYSALEIMYKGREALYETERA